MQLELALRPSIGSGGVTRAPSADPEELHAALEAAGAGAWALDLRSGSLHTAGRYAALVGGPSAPADFAFPRFEDFLAVVHPDDREEVAGGPRPVGPAHRFVQEFRVRWPDGRLRWLSSRGQVLVGDDGAPYKVTGVLVDVTEQREAERHRDALLAAERAARASAQEGQRRLARLESVTEAGLAHLSVDELLEELLGRVRDALTVDTVVVWLPGESGRLEARAAIGFRLGAALVLSTEDSVRLLLHRRGPIVIHEDDLPESARPHLQAQGIRSLAVVRLVVEGRATGLLQVGSSERREFDEGDLTLLQLVADRIALAIERAQTYEESHSVAEALQRSLLPDGLPEVPELDLAGVYVPGAGAAVGGDWYDVITLPGGQLALVMGDVVGRGVRAASVMGQLRGACRIFAAQGQRPGEVVACLNEYAAELSDGEMATLAYVVLDPQSGTGSAVTAGHPPPLVRSADGRCSYVPVDPQPPLGAMRGWRYDEQSFSLGCGELVLLYTDGLVERRDASLDEGLERLAAILPATPEDPEDCCRELLEAFVGPKQADDDTALLAVRRTDPGTGPLVLHLPADLSTLRPLRRRLRAWLERVGADADEAHDLVLAASEAAANAAEHAYGPAAASFEVTAGVEDGVVEIDVRDSGRWRPPRDSDRGRGLLLMEGLVDEVVVDRRDDGTHVRLRRAVGAAAPGAAQRGRAWS